METKQIEAKRDNKWNDNFIICNIITSFNDYNDNIKKKNKK